MICFLFYLIFIVTYCVATTGILLIKSIRNRVGVILSLLTLATVIICEFTVDPERWHNIRGAQMIISMKGKLMAACRPV